MICGQQTHITHPDEQIKELEQKVIEQAAVIEKLLSKLGEIAGSKSLTATPTQFYQHLQRLASDATITTDSSQVLQEWLDAALGTPVAWMSEYKGSQFIVYNAAKESAPVAYQDFTIGIYRKPVLK